MNEERLRRLALRAAAGNVLVMLIGAFAVSYLGGPAAGMAAVLMTVAGAAPAAVAGGAVAMRSMLQRVQRDLENRERA